MIDVVGGPRRALLEGVLQRAIAAVHPRECLPPHLRAPDGALAPAGLRPPADTRFVGLAIGKAAVAMAAVFEALAGRRIRAGLAITRDGHGPPAGQSLERFALRFAAHPVPDARSEAAAHEALALARSCRADEWLIVLLSGGASALTSAPAAGLTLAGLQATTAALLEGGADIETLNIVRKHLGCFGGGRLARASRAGRTVVLAISDVPGDRLDLIGSGPCAPDPSRYADALGALRRLCLADALPPAAIAALEQGAAGRREETPDRGDPAFARVHSRIVACNDDARHAALAGARRAGLEACDWGVSLAGEARAAAERLLERGLREAPRVAKGRLAVAGGETTVTVRGPGRGGRNQELALAAALTGEGRGGWTLLAAGTDGSDGPTDAAGACADGGTVARGRERGVCARRALERNDSYGFFAREGGLLRTGPTHTNVMDLALLWLGPSGHRAGAARGRGGA